MTNISDFVEHHLDPIVAEWVEFAHTCKPLGDLSDVELADHAKVLLLAITADMRTAQTALVSRSKSVGNEPDNAPNMTNIAREHAMQRFKQGFSMDHLIAEFRALRASVTRRWTSQVKGIARDAIDDLIRFEEAIDQALTESASLYSSQVNDSRNLLLGVLGHDLRSPLGVVHMTTQYLLRGDKLDGEMTKAVVRVLTAAERMKTMVSDLLDFTRTALGIPLPVVPAPADLGHIVVAIAEEVGTLHPESVISTTCHGDLTGQWDAARIEQMLANLISNAVQHGDRSMPVTVCASGEGDTVSLEVHNEGPPMSPETLRNLFRPLQQPSSADAVQHTSSSGLSLGLYIAREIAVAHGGSVEVTSDQQGTTFRVGLPRTPPVQKGKTHRP